MKNKAVLFATWIVILILSACSPFVIASSSGGQPTPVIETAPATGYQLVQVDQGAEVGVGSPIPVQVTVTGTLPPNNINPSAIAISDWPSDYEQQCQVIEAYNSEALQRFEQMSDGDVLPNLALPDQLVQSIQVSQP